MFTRLYTCSTIYFNILYRNLCNINNMNIFIFPHVYAAELYVHLLAVSSKCPLLNHCGNNGVCKEGSCICSEGYNGTYCEQGIYCGHSLQNGTNGALVVTLMYDIN